MSVNTKMTAIANEIRILSGTTSAMGLDAMATNVGNANSEIDSQADLLFQIVTALEGKAADGGSAEIGTFTMQHFNCSSSQLYSHPFVVGMTWQEYVDSPINNYKLNNLDKATTKFAIMGDQVVFSLNNSYTKVCETSLSTSAVRADSLIKNGYEYKFSEISDGGGSNY